MTKKCRLRMCEVEGTILRKIEISTEIRHSTFTESELDICERLLRDQSYEEIAEARGTTRSTVASQVQTIFEKFEVSSASELLVVLARSQ